MTPVDPSCTPQEHTPLVAPRSPYGRAAFERAASIFRAAGDVARLRLLEQLTTREWCVTELADSLDEGLSTVSQRLRLLRSEGLVTRRREGKHIYYTVADHHVAELIHNALDHASEDPAASGTGTHEDPTP